MDSLENDLRFLGVLEKAAEIAQDLGSEAAVRYVRSSYHLLCKVYHPDLHRRRNDAANQGQVRLNQIKCRLDQTSDDDLARFLGRRGQASDGHPRVLVVEDEDGLKDNLADLLGLEGYHVATAANGALGLREHLIFRPELVITDVVMPVMNGVEMIRHLRRRDAALKAIFISGFFGTHAVRAELREEIERLGYPALSKPFRPSQILALVRQALA